MAASSGVSLDNTNLLNPTASCRGCVSPTPRERGRSSSSQNNELELKGRNNLAGEGGGALAVHEDRGELRRNSRNIGIEKRASVRKGDVLVVDDTSTVRSLLKRAVTRMGHGVDTACTGQVRLSAWAAPPPPSPAPSYRCSLPFMRLAEYLKALRAWCT